MSENELPYAHLDKGTFLIATPEIDSGLFARAVLLLCEHTPNGSFGLVINKTIDLELPEELVNFEHMNNPRVGIRVGGVAQTNQMLILHSSKSEEEHSVEICSGVYLGGDLPFLQASLSTAEGPAIRLCFGYCGWGSGQLEREFLDGKWFLTPASAHHIFETSPEKLWQTLLREMGGKYATLSMIPEDLSLN